MELFKPIQQETSIEIVLTRQQKEIIKDTTNFVRSLHDNFDDSSGEKLARLFFAAVDLDGFCIDLDEVYSLVGYAQKYHAKRQLESKATKLRKGIDYEEMSESNYLLTTSGEQKKRQHGGHNKTKIMMTSRGFSQFALSARTDKGVALRDFIQYLTVRMKNIVNNVAQNNVNIRPVGDRAEERLLACESQKSLMEVATSLGIKHKIIVNGESNHTVTGKRKKEIMEEMGVAHKKVNSVTARDYMTDRQLHAINLIEECTKKDIEGVEDPNEIVDIHRDNCQNVFGSRGIRYLQSQTLEPRLGLQKARRQKQIADQ